MRLETGSFSMVHPGLTGLAKCNITILCGDFRWPSTSRIAFWRAKSHLTRHLLIVIDELVLAGFVAIYNLCDTNSCTREREIRVVFQREKLIKTLVAKAEPIKTAKTAGSKTLSLPRTNNSVDMGVDRHS